jgi:hypothetical protein
MFRKRTSGWSNTLKADHWYLPAPSCPTRRAARPASSLRTFEDAEVFPAILTSSSSSRVSGKDGSTGVACFPLPDRERSRETVQECPGVPGTVALKAVEGAIVPARPQAEEQRQTQGESFHVTLGES